MPVTLIVEPDPGGHRFQAVANVALLAGRRTDVVLVTTRGARRRDEFANFLEHLSLEVDERFTDIHPPTREMAAAIADHARARDVAQALVMDADQSLKHWWHVARREFRGLGRRRPQVIFMLTRYPAKLRLTDRVGWLLRVSKATLALLAMATGTLHRVAGFAGREDLSAGWLVKRARDPAICTAHARERAKLRADLGLPAERPIVGIFGVISARKNAPFVLDAIEASGVDADLLLGGKVQEDSAAWLASLPGERLARVVVDDGFHTDAHLDRLVAASDVVAIALTNNGPSGIMGKALAAGVPVVTAGSHVRATELRFTGAGVGCELTVDSFGEALRHVLTGTWTMQNDVTPPASGEAFAAVLLGIDLR